MGIEALSRGAGFVWFVEKAERAVTLLSKNLAMADNNLYTVMKKDAFDAIDHIKNKGINIDIVYIDPPYAEKDVYGNILMKLLNSNIMNKSYIIGIEHAGYNEESIKDAVGSHTLKTYKYGDSRITMMRGNRNG